MYYRNNLQPDPMVDYELVDIYGNEYVGRWLVGKTYEGWYVKSDEVESYKAVYSQNELRIYGYRPVGSNREFKRYIPKRLLDDAFYGHKSISDFRETPEILSYI